MYDFYFGTKKEIYKNPEDFLIFCKRLLPRWINGIPDSECLAIYRSLSNLKKNPVMIETGCGASTLAMFLHAALNSGKVYSWDTNGSKGSFLRSVINEAICLPLDLKSSDFWKFIAFDSTNDFLGIPILNELDDKADSCYFDSWHTFEHLMKEIRCFEKVSNNEFMILLDDAYYSNKYENFSYINMMRKKLNLAPIKDPEDNKVRKYFEEVDDYLNKKYEKVKKLEDSYKDEFQGDIFFKYFQQDRNAMEKVGMEEKENLSHRFDAWIVKK